DVGVDGYRAAGTDSGHPLLGQRLHSARATWEVALGQASLAYLEEHRLQDSVIFPAAAYIEMVLAAARQVHGREPVAVEKLELRRLLALERREETLLQCLHDPRDSVIEIHSAAQGDDPAWTLHVTAQLRSSPPAPAQPVDLAGIRQRCTREVAAEDHYRRL